MNAIRGLMELLYERWILLKSKTTTTNANELKMQTKWKKSMQIEMENSPFDSTIVANIANKTTNS